jgi:hypothetical protein
VVRLPELGDRTLRLPTWAHPATEARPPRREVPEDVELGWPLLPIDTATIARL